MFFTFLHAHSFVRAKYGDANVLQLLAEDILGDVLREKEVEGETSLAN
jgi:hypothetical protein